MLKFILGVLILLTISPIALGDEIENDDLEIFEGEELENDDFYFSDDFIDEDLGDFFGEEEFLPESISDFSQPGTGNGSSSGSGVNSSDFGSLGGSSFNNIDYTASSSLSTYKTLSISGRKAIHQKILALYYGKSNSEKNTIKLKLGFRIKSLEKKYSNDEYALKVLKYLDYRVNNY